MDNELLRKLMKRRGMEEEGDITLLLSNRFQSSVVHSFQVAPRKRRGTLRTRMLTPLQTAPLCRAPRPVSSVTPLPRALPSHEGDQLPAPLQLGEIWHLHHPGSIEVSITSRVCVCVCVYSWFSCLPHRFCP